MNSWATASESHEVSFLAGHQRNKQLDGWAQAVAEPLAVIACYGIVGSCVMAVTIIDLIVGTCWLGKIRQQDRRQK